MKYIFPALSILFCLVGYSQDKQYIYYFDQDLNPVEKSKLIFKGIGIFQDSTLEFKLYDGKTNNLVGVEHYTDSSLSEENGLFEYFYPNGTLSSRGSYEHGVHNGLWTRWDSVGRMTDSAIYLNGSKIFEVRTGYYNNGNLDSIVVENFKTDHLDKTFYNEKGKLVSEINFVGQNGIVKRYDSVMNVTIDTATSRLEIEASFPGGDVAWNAYIVKGLQRNADNIIDAGMSGTCRLKFIVLKDGSIGKVEAVTMQGTKLARIAVNIISRSPKWNPAVQYGRYVNAYREQPISFTLQDR